MVYLTALGLTLLGIVFCLTGFSDQSEFKSLDLKSKEYSGIDLGYNQQLWSHPDSGNSSELYRFTIGEEKPKVATFPISVSNRDWEDLSIGPCRHLIAEKCLFLGEIGGGSGFRHPTIYEFNLDDLNEYSRHDIDYVDRVADAEALAVADDVFFIMKKNGSQDLYREIDSKFVVCGTLDQIPKGYVVAMDIHDEEPRVLVSIQTKEKGIWQYRVYEYWLNNLYECQVQKKKQRTTPTNRQLEAVAYYSEGQAIGLTERGDYFVFDVD